MKKLLVGTMITAGTMFMGAQLASAHVEYPPTDPDDGSVAPLPPATPTSPDAPSPAAPSTGGLPATGGESMMLLQVGLVTVAAGGAIVGAAAVRRRRFAGS